MAAPLLIPILGDQLTTDIASLRDADPRSSVVLMMEVADETTYVRHHKAKIAFIHSLIGYAAGLRLFLETRTHVEGHEVSTAHAGVV